MMLRSLVPAVALIFATTSAAASDANEWATKSAQTIAGGRVEVGALSSTTWGVTERVEVGAHPIGLFVFPAARAKINWWQMGHLTCDEGDLIFHPRVWVSSQHRVFSPTPLLHLFAREGSGGLLPANSDIPFALGMENQALLTASVAGHLLTASLGLTVTAREKSELSMVEFPFLYSMLASLYSPAVPSVGLAFEGNILGPFDYQFAPRLHVFRPEKRIAWPAERPPWVFAQDTVLRVHARLGERHRLSLGIATTVAHYPIGTRLHYVPTLDYRFALAR